MHFQWISVSLLAPSPSTSLPVGVRGAQVRNNQIAPPSEVTLHNRTVVTLDGRCVCALPTLYGTWGLGRILAQATPVVVQSSPTASGRRLSNANQSSQPQAAMQVEGLPPAPGGDRYNWSDAVPAALWDRAIGVKELVLMGNGFRSIPPKVAELKTVERLDLSENQLQALPTEVGTLSFLRQLSITANSLTTLPTELGNLGRLEMLSVPANQLITLPTELGNCASLAFLNVQHTGSSGVPIPTELGRFGANLQIATGPLCQDTMGTPALTQNCMIVDGTGARPRSMNHIIASSRIPARSCPHRPAKPVYRPLANDARPLLHNRRHCLRRIIRQFAALAPTAGGIRDTDNRGARRGRRG